MINGPVIQEADSAVVTIDPEFAALCPPLTAAERGLLEENLKAEGCCDPLVTWKGLLVDGHNRHEICTRLGIEFVIRRVTLEDREAAINWIIANQLGRRNITPEQASYLRGKRYNREKKPKEGHRGANQHTKSLTVNSCRSADTSKRLAEEYKVSDTSIRSDGVFAKALDTIAENHGEAVPGGLHLPARGRGVLGGPDRHRPVPRQRHRAPAKHGAGQPGAG